VSYFVDLLLDFLVVFCPKVRESGSHDRHMIAEFDTLKSRLFSTCSDLVPVSCLLYPIV
jgi:hypothetical protein